MPKPTAEFTPVRPRDGGLVHAVAVGHGGPGPLRTSCGRPTSGWVIGAWPLTCRECLTKVFYRVQDR